MPNFKKQIAVLAMIPLGFNTLSFPPGNLLLAQHEMSLENRYQDKFVNEVFRNNILLNLAYMDGRVSSSGNIKWDEVLKSFQYGFKLEPNKTFAFHADVKDRYKDSLVKTTNAHFNSQEGFKTDGYLFGDGVCHLASLINWVAKDAGLLVEAPTKHDFANIPDIPKEYGVSIYSYPGSKNSNAQQNLYITNNKDKPVTFRFEYQDNEASFLLRNKVKVSVVELRETK